MDVSSKCSSPTRASATPTRQDMAVLLPMRAQPPVHQWDGPPYNRTGYQSISTTSRLPQAQLDGGVQLPSIRNLIPGYIPPLENDRPAAYNYSPSRGPAPVETSYETSPASKRRRVSEDENEDRLHEKVYAVPRSQSRQTSQGQSPMLHENYPASQFSSSNYPSTRPVETPYMNNRSSISRPSIETPTYTGQTGGLYDPAMNDFRPVLPSLPSMLAMDGPQSGLGPPPDPTRETTHRGLHSQHYHTRWDASTPPQSVYGEPEYSFVMPNEGYNRNPRMQVTERSPFTAGQVYHSQDRHQFDMRASIGDGGKQRKRRGNLPKDTTDKLRTWFHQHLRHPYPTEDEKQELMRSTGLQMNQISNWFINARRRQLPSLINQNRSEANSARSTDADIPGLHAEHNSLEGSDDNTDEDEVRKAGTSHRMMQSSTASKPLNSTARVASVYPYMSEGL